MMKRLKKHTDWWWAYLMIGPSIIGLIILNIWPLCQTVFLSFTKSLGFGRYEWCGTENYVRMFSDPEVWRSTWNMILFSLYTVPIGVFLALVFGALLNAKIRAKGLYRTVYFLPVVCASAAVAMIWRWMFNGEYGLINYFIMKMGGEGIRWLTQSPTALIAVSAVAVWSRLGYNIVLVIAGLQDVPESLYESAKIDGAGPIRRFFHISIPMVSPTLFFVIITTVMEALKQFDFIYMMIFRENPALESCQTLLNVFYEYGFVAGEKGYASAIVVLSFCIIMVVTIIQFIGQKKWVHYSD